MHNYNDVQCLLYLNGSYNRIIAANSSYTLTGLTPNTSYTMYFNDGSSPEEYRCPYSSADEIVSTNIGDLTIESFMYLDTSYSVRVKSGTTYIEGATVTCSNGKTATTSSSGIASFTELTQNTSYTFVATKASYTTSGTLTGKTLKTMVAPTIATTSSTLKFTRQSTSPTTVNYSVVVGSTTKQGTITGTTPVTVSGLSEHTQYSIVFSATDYNTVYTSATTRYKLAAAENWGSIYNSITVYNPNNIAVSCSVGGGTAQTISAKGTYTFTGLAVDTGYSVVFTNSSSSEYDVTSQTTLYTSTYGSLTSPEFGDINFTNNRVQL